MKIKVKTTSGTTIIETDKICAITETLDGGGLLTAPDYVLDIHMENGTIFTTKVQEEARVVIYHSWGADIALD